MGAPKNYIFNFRVIGLAVCFLFLASGGVQAQLEDLKKMWTTVGSAGTVDETDVNKVFFDRSSVQMGHVLANPLPGKKSALISGQTQSAVIRYNITAVSGLLVQCGNFPCQAFIMNSRFLAAGGGRVVLKLIEVDQATGSEITRLILNSGPADRNSYQFKQVKTCGEFHQAPFNFVTKAYYIEATLTTAGITTGSAAGIQMIKLGASVCLGGE